MAVGSDEGPMTLVTSIKVTDVVVDSKFVLYKILPTTGFELQASGIESDCFDI